jgi:hypothetical protein
VECPSASRSWRTDGIADDPAAKPVPRAVSPLEAGLGSRESATSDELAEEPTGGGRVWILITVVASLLVVAATSLVGIHFTRKWRAAADERAGQSQSSHASSAPQIDPSQIRWTDASQRSQRLGRVELKIERVKYGAVRAKDLNNDVITTDDANLLAITVSLLNRSDQPCPFHSWYAAGTTTDGEAEPLPELSDDAGHSYDLLLFDDVSSIEGQRLTDGIEPRHDVQDTVVFSIPADVDRTKIQCFHLTLPAHVIGRVDFFRFKVPVGMIIDF